jgi:hypothetical protein
MSKTVRKVSLAFLLLLLSAAGSCFAGYRQLQNEVQQFEKNRETSGFYMTHASFSPNYWQITGFLLFFVSVAVGIAAFILLEQDRNNNH